MSRIRLESLERMAVAQGDWILAREIRIRISALPVPKAPKRRSAGKVVETPACVRETFSRQSRMNRRRRGDAM